MRERLVEAIRKLGEVQRELELCGKQVEADGGTMNDRFVGRRLIETSTEVRVIETRLHQLISRLPVGPQG